jgi:hypothetical protein
MRQPLTPYRTLDEVVDILAKNPYRPERRSRHKRGCSPKARLAAERIENRKLLRRAFDTVRRDPFQVELKRRLSAALGGGTAINEKLLNNAAAILGVVR